MWKQRADEMPENFISIEISHRIKLRKHKFQCNDTNLKRLCQAINKCVEARYLMNFDMSFISLFDNNILK